ncbi:MAG TPA: hypothetical protein VFB74_24595 [Kribbellaceae bacterium]|nr:hypothetical protein [Kribbellaceae bacterium]
MTTTSTEGPLHTPRPTAEVRAQEKMSGVTSKLASFLRRMDVREGRKIFKKASRDTRRDLRSNSQSSRDLAESAARYGVSPEQLAVAQRAATEAYLQQVVAQSGPDAARAADTQAALAAATTGVEQAGTQARPDSPAAGSEAAVKPIDRGKGRQGLGE